MSEFSSDINLQLPAIPLVTDPALRTALLPVYQALHILHKEVTDLKARVKALEPPAP